MGLSNSTYDEAQLKFCNAITSWLIKNVWLSDRSNGEEAGCYYANETTNTQVNMIELYTMVFQSPVDQHQQDLTPSRLGRILSIDGWCSGHPGTKNLVKFSKALPPSSYASQFQPI